MFRHSRRFCSIVRIPALSGTPPYSAAAIGSGSRLVFSSGQIGIAQDGKLVADSVEEQTKQVFANLREVLQASNSGLHKVLKTTCFLTDMADYSVFNQVYLEEFAGLSLPARSCIAVRALPFGAKVEIEAVAEVAADQ